MCIKLFRRKNAPEDVKKAEKSAEEVKQAVEEKAENTAIPAPPVTGKAKRSITRTQPDTQGIGQVPLPGSGTGIKK